jgi:phosphotransacetylase
MSCARPAGLPATLIPGQRKRSAVPDGPLTFDYAINRKAAAVKHITSPIAGDAEILLVPDLEARIVLCERMTIILTSRAENVRAHGELRHRRALCPCPAGGRGWNRQLAS